MNPYIKHRMCSRKHRFGSEFKAQSAVYQALRQPGRPVLRFYQCPVCSGFHLTSQK